MTQSIRSSIRHFIEGFFIGTANVIPGVSGGTMALIFGIYEKLIDAMSHLFKAALAVVRFDLEGLRGHLREVPWLFIAALAAGGLVATITGPDGRTRTYREEGAVFGLFWLPTLVLTPFASPLPQPGRLQRDLVRAAWVRATQDGLFGETGP